MITFIASSNKPQKKLLKDYQQAIGPTILKPKIDKIAICVPIMGKENQEAIKNNLISFCKEPNSEFVELHGKGGYKHHVKMFIQDENDKGGWLKDHVLIQVHPYSSKAPYVRLEFNPYKLGPKGMEYLKPVMEALLPDGYPQVLKYGYVTRIDIALDFPGTALDDLVIQGKQKRVAAHFAGTDGRLETIQLGSSKSNQIVAYDKAKELAKHGVKPLGKMTRIEFRLKPHIPLLDLPNLKNPLTRLIVYDLSDIAFPGPPSVLEWFRDACRVRGIKAALQLAKTDEGTSLATTWFGALTIALKPGVQKWWQPDSLWESWKVTLNESQLLSKE